MAQPAMKWTTLIEAYRSGDKEAEEKLFHTVYAELKKIAKSQMRGQRSDNTLVPTALVHEAFVRLSQRKDLEIQSQKHFFVIAATCMRWILRDHARAKGQIKRGGPKTKIEFDEKMHGAAWDETELIVLHDLLEKLSLKDARLAQVVELRVLLGLGLEEVADVLQVSRATVNRDWMVARAWLRKAFDE